MTIILAKNISHRSYQPSTLAQRATNSLFNKKLNLTSITSIAGLRKNYKRTTPISRLVNWVKRLLRIFYPQNKR